LRKPFAISLEVVGLQNFQIANLELAVIKVRSVVMVNELAHEQQVTEDRRR